MKNAESASKLFKHGLRVSFIDAYNVVLGHRLIPSKDSDISNYLCMKTSYDENARIFCISDIALITYWFALMVMTDIALMTYCTDATATEENVKKYKIRIWSTVMMVYCN